MDAARPKIAGIDIDGVLADPTHRLHHLERSPKSWRGFFGDAHLDPPLAEGLDTVHRLAGEGLGIVYVSGRPEYLSRDTARWLKQHGLPTGPLHLRPRRDFRPAPVLKLELYRALMVDHDIAVIVDDDTRVVERLRAAGLTVTHADWYRPPQADHDALAEAQDEQGRT